MIEVKDKDVVLARYIPASTAWEEGLSFSDDDDYIQVGTWGYDSPIVAHTHKGSQRCCVDSGSYICKKRQYQG